jgi:hypothetical protein
MELGFEEYLVINEEIFVAACHSGLDPESSDIQTASMLDAGSSPA